MQNFDDFRREIYEDTCKLLEYIYAKYLDYINKNELRIPKNFKDDIDENDSYELRIQKSFEKVAKLFTKVYEGISNSDKFLKLISSIYAINTIREDDYTLDQLMIFTNMINTYAHFMEGRNSPNEFNYTGFSYSIKEKILKYVLDRYPNTSFISEATDNNTNAQYAFKAFDIMGNSAYMFHLKEKMDGYDESQHTNAISFYGDKNTVVRKDTNYKKIVDYLEHRGKNKDDLLIAKKIYEIINLKIPEKIIYINGEDIHKKLNEILTQHRAIDFYNILIKEFNKLLHNIINSNSVELNEEWGKYISKLAIITKAKTTKEILTLQDEVEIESYEFIGGGQYEEKSDTQTLDKVSTSTGMTGDILKEQTMSNEELPIAFDDAIKRLINVTEESKMLGKIRGRTVKDANIDVLIDIELLEQFSEELKSIGSEINDNTIKRYKEIALERLIDSITKPSGENNGLRKIVEVKKTKSDGRLLIINIQDKPKKPLIYKLADEQATRCVESGISEGEGRISEITNFEVLKKVADGIKKKVKKSEEVKKEKEIIESISTKKDNEELPLDFDEAIELLKNETEESKMLGKIRGRTVKYVNIDVLIDIELLEQFAEELKSIGSEINDNTIKRYKEIALERLIDSITNPSGENNGLRKIVEVKKTKSDGRLLIINIQAKPNKPLIYKLTDEQATRCVESGISEGEGRSSEITNFEVLKKVASEIKEGRVKESEGVKKSKGVRKKKEVAQNNESGIITEETNKKTGLDEPIQVEAVAEQTQEIRRFFPNANTIDELARSPKVQEKLIEFLNLFPDMPEEDKAIITLIVGRNLRNNPKKGGPELC